MENAKRPVGVMEKAVQTDAQMMQNKSGLLPEEARPSCCLVTASNSNSEDSLCRIEHAPLDGFPFPQVGRQQSCRPEPEQPSSARECSVDLTHIIVRADINHQDSNDVTVV